MTDHRSLGEQNYEQFADRYAAMVETKPHNAYYERPATLSLLPDVRGLQVLDAGCGPGIYTEWLLDHGASVVACDVTPRMVELTRQRVKDRADSRATILQADLSQPLTFAADNTFDLVICPLVLDYLKDWEPTFREYHRVLKPGGTFVFSCGHPFGDYLYLTQRRRQIGSGNYFKTELYTLYWGGFGDPHPLIKTYRRPLSEAINPLLRVGFVLETILEPQPVEDFQPRDPESYDLLTRQPGFLCVRARKPL